MNRAEAWFTHLAVLLVAGSGLVYGWMRYFAEPEDPFAVVNHPWQPDLQHLHVLAAPLLVFALGMLWRGHIRVKLAGGSRRHRPTGLLLLGLLAPMIASGYLVQVTLDETWRSVWVWTHGISSCLFVLFYLGHLLGARQQVAEAGSTE